MSHDARRVLLGGLIDHAALFPPASMPMPEAIEADRAARATEHAWILDRFICPASKLDELPRERSILVICQTGSRSRHATEFLTQIGYTDVANVLGGSSAWRRAGKPLVREESASSTRS